jgi:hypothetical protein
VIVVLIAKFTEGAWITLVLIPALILIMRLVKRHYNRWPCEVDLGSARLNTAGLAPPLMVIAVDRWSRITQKPCALPCRSHPTFWRCT